MTGIQCNIAFGIASFYPIYLFVLDPSSSRITPWLLVVMGIMCAICFGAVIHTVMEVKRARKLQILSRTYYVASRLPAPENNASFLWQNF